MSSHAHHAPHHKDESKYSAAQIKKLVTKKFKEHGAAGAEALFNFLVGQTTGLSTEEHKHLHNWSMGKGFGKKLKKPVPRKVKGKEKAKKKGKVTGGCRRHGSKSCDHMSCNGEILGAR